MWHFYVGAWVCGSRPLLLPSANEVAERLCFYTCLSFCPQGRGMSAPVRSCGQGYVFTHVCDSVHGGGLPQCMLGYHTTPWEAHPPGGTPPGSTPPRDADSGIRSMSGRYASYWNAFLLIIVLYIT